MIMVLKSESETPVQGIDYFLLCYEDECVHTCMHVCVFGPYNRVVVHIRYYVNKISRLPGLDTNGIPK